MFLVHQNVTFDKW